MNIEQALEALILARIERKKAQKVFVDACSCTGFGDDWGDYHMKFNAQHDPEGVILRYEYTDAYKRFNPAATAKPVKDHIDFIVWRAASENRFEANKAHGIALRRLLAIGRNNLNRKIKNEQ